MKKKSKAEKKISKVMKEFGPMPGIPQGPIIRMSGVSLP